MLVRGSNLGWGSPPPVTIYFQQPMVYGADYTITEAVDTSFMLRLVPGRTWLSLNSKIVIEQIETQSSGKVTQVQTVANVVPPTSVYILESKAILSSSAPSLKASLTHSRP